MKTLITGGAGFIGSHLSERLLAIGHAVAILDDLSLGSLDNLAGVDSHPDLEVVFGDVRDEAQVDALVAPADMVYHLAAWNRERSEGFLADATQVNVTGVGSVLKAAARHSVPVVYASCSDVYGKGGQQPLREDAECRLGPTTDPVWAFASMKLLAESLCVLSAGRGLPVTILRLFDIYGPRDCSGLTDRLLRLHLKGPLDQPERDMLARSLMYVSDAVDALVLAGQSPAGAGQIVNIGWDRPASEQCVRPDGANLWIADLTKARRLLGFEPKVRFHEGLRLARSRVGEVT